MASFHALYARTWLSRRWHLGFKSGLTLAILAALLMTTLLCEMVGWPFLRGPLEHQLTGMLERPVALGDGFRIRFLGSIRARLDTLSIGPPSWDRGVTDPSAFVDAKGVYVKVPYSTLWHLYRRTGAPPHLDALEVNDLQARLLRESSGRANWDLLPASPAPQAPAPIPTFDRLLLQTGHVVLDDAVSVIQLDARVHTREGSAERPTAASVAVSASAASATSTEAAGLLVEGGGSYKSNPVTFHVESEGALPLLATDGSGPSVRLAFDASAGRSKLQFSGTATDVLHLTGVNGTYEVSGPSLAAIGDAVGVTLPTTAAFSISGHLEKQGKVFSAQVAELSVGTSRLTGQFKFDTAPSTPLLTGRLDGSRLALGDLGPAIGAGSSKGAPNPPPPPGKVLPQREFDIPSLKAMNAEVQVRLAQADLGTSALQPFAPLDVDVTLKDGLLLLDNIRARTSGGEFQGSLRLDSVPAVPRFAANLRWSGIKLEDWLKVSNPRDAKARAGGKPPPYITGKVLGNAKPTGEGKSTAAIVGSLDGTVALAVRDGTVSHLIIEAVGLDVAQGLGMLLKGDDALPMDCALLRLTSNKGQVKADAGLIDTSDSLLIVSGQLSLDQETLDLKLTDKPKDFSPLSLRAPLDVRGTFAKPSVLPEAKTLSAKVVAAAVLATLAPAAAIIPFFDLGDKEAIAGCASILSKSHAAQ